MVSLRREFLLSTHVCLSDNASAVSRHSRHEREPRNHPQHHERSPHIEPRISLYLLTTPKQPSMAQIELDQTLLATSTNKTILITGAARGIGLATAKLFNQHGANVVLADLVQFRDAAEEEIKAEFVDPSRAIFVPGNIADWAELTACFKTAVERFGCLDVVVANAGVMESRPVLDMGFVDENGELCEDTEAGRVIDVNLKGTLNSISSWTFFPLLLWPSYTNKPAVQPSA